MLDVEHFTYVGGGGKTNCKQWHWSIWCGNPIVQDDDLVSGTSDV